MKKLLSLILVALMLFSFITLPSTVNGVKIIAYTLLLLFPIDKAVETE